MTKKEKELEHDRQTLMMMANVSRHADVQQMLSEEKPMDPYMRYLIVFCAGCLTTAAIAMLFARFG